MNRRVLAAVQAGARRFMGIAESWGRADGLAVVNELERIALSNEPAVRAAFDQAVRRLKNAVNLPAVASALEQGDATAAMAAIPWDQIGAPALANALRKSFAALFSDAYTTSADQMPDALRPEITRDDALAAAWAHSQSGTKVVQIGDETRLGIRNAIARTLSTRDAEKLTPGQAAKTIRNMIGLTERQTDWVANYRAQLVKDGRDPIKAARAGDRYAAKILAYRADLIARTETVAAVNAGHVEAWAEAERTGLIDAEKIVREWHVTKDDRLDRLICAPMAGQKTLLYQTFLTPQGVNLIGPPAHPG